MAKTTKKIILRKKDSKKTLKNNKNLKKNKKNVKKNKKNKKLEIYQQQDELKDEEQDKNNLLDKSKMSKEEIKLREKLYELNN